MEYFNLKLYTEFLKKLEFSSIPKTNSFNGRLINYLYAWCSWRL